jgi:hypothetical protein
MLKHYFTILSICLLSFQCFAQSPFYSQVKFIKEETTTNSLTVEVIGFGKNQTKSEENCAYNLFMTIFFRGIPNSPSPSPLLGPDESVYFTANQNYFKSFFRQKKYNSFINSRNCLKIEKVNKRKQVTCRYKVNIPGIINELKSSKLLKEYGF